MSDQIVSVVNGNPVINYRITSPSAPIRRADGTPLQDGDMWFDSDYGMNRTYSSGVWRAPGVYEAGVSLVSATTALGLSSTSGFLVIPTCAGTPTGIPVLTAGQAALVFDTSGLKLFIYNAGAGGWKSVTLA